LVKIRVRVRVRVRVDRVQYAASTLLVLERQFALEDTIGTHACSGGNQHISPAFLASCSLTVL
jgi:hypothetical protein